MANEDDRFGQAQIALMVWLGLAGLITVLLLLSYYFNQKGKKKKEKKPDNQQAAPVPNDGPVRRRRGMRQARQVQEDDSDYDEDDEDTGEIFVDKDGKKMGKKKMQKMEMKAE